MYYYPFHQTGNKRYRQIKLLANSPMQALLQNGNTELRLNPISKQQLFHLKHGLHQLLKRAAGYRQKFESHSQCIQELVTCITPSPENPLVDKELSKQLHMWNCFKSYCFFSFLHFASLLYRM